MSAPVISVAQMRVWEQATWATGQTEVQVIRRVGERVAHLARLYTSNCDSILILAGKGHNGDDARAAKEFLGDREVKLIELLLPHTDIFKVELALRDRPTLIIDGIFGIGLNRPLADSWQKIITAVNTAQIPVLAIDVPSGLNADSGESFGAVITAAVTLTIGAPKMGLLTASAAVLVGRLEVADDVGLIPCPYHAGLNLTQAEDFQKFPAARPVAGHKASFGHALIIAGSFGFHGAAVLSACGAQRAQPGLVTLLTQENVYVPVASQLQSAMVNLWQPEAKWPESNTALLVGPGLAGPKIADRMRAPLRHWWRDYPHPLVVDASAFDILEAEPFAKKVTRVLTPHPGEAARLLNSTTSKVQADRVAAVRNISKKFGGCWVVLKGHHTLIGRCEGKMFINPSGNPQLAQGGSGDLLAGFIVGLLAQPALQVEVEKVLRYAVWQHGAAADKLSVNRLNWTIEDLAEEIGNVR